MQPTDKKIGTNFERQNTAAKNQVRVGIYEYEYCIVITEPRT